MCGTLALVADGASGMHPIYVPVHEYFAHNYPIT